LNKSRVVEVALLLLILAASTIQFLYWDQKFTDNELASNGKGYVSDEVWYVASARNILVKVLHLNPREVGYYGYTIVYDGVLDRGRVEEVASLYGVKLRFDYSRLNGFYAYSSNASSLNLFLRRLREIANVSDVVPGWMMPDASGINNYLNLEHPPLAKYVIALIMATVGDYPFYWRLGTIVAGTLLVLFTYLITRRLLNSAPAALASASLLAADPLARNLSSIALLDVYVALFTAVSFYLALEKRFKLSLLAVLVGSLFKFNTLFALIPVSLLYVREKLKGRYSFLDLIAVFLGFYIASGAGFLLAQVVAGIPLIGYLGFTSWFKQSITGAIAWHTQIKCLGNACPTSSAPWDWFTGVNSFTLYYFPGGLSVTASGFWPLWSFTLAAAMIFLPSYLKGNKAFAHSTCWLLGVLSGYIFLWIIGGRTQYSFYAVQLAPLVYTSLTVILATFNYDRVVEVLESWKHLFTRMNRALGRLLLLE